MGIVGWVNVALVTVSLGAFVFYVIQANGMTAQVWQARDARERLASIQEDRNTLVAQKSALEDRQQLAALAAQTGMVPMGTVVYLVQDRPVAAR